MSLLASVMSPCVLLVEIPVDDPLGGYQSQWVEGATFDAFVRKEEAPEITVADKSEVKERLTIVMPKDTPLKYHSVIKRLSDGEIFRLISTPKDFEAPLASSIQIMRADVERWELP